MAMVSPYSDPNAHGQINKTFCFQRYKKKVFMRTLPRPVSRNTADQIIQRQKLSDASKAYSLLTGNSKYYYRKRASQKSKTGLNLFMSGHMKNYLPSTLLPIPAKSIEDMVIFTPAGLYSDEIKISIVNEYHPFSFHNKHGSLDEIENSVIGPDGVSTGLLTYDTAKFNKGVDNFSNTNFVTYPDAITQNNIAVQFWYKPNWASTQGIRNNQIIFYGTFFVDYFSFRWAKLTKQWVCRIYDDMGNHSFYVFDPIAFIPGDLFCLTLIVDPDAGPDEKMRLYHGDTELANHVYLGDHYLNDNPWDWGEPIDLRFSRQNFYDDCNGVVDNPKMINNTTQLVINSFLASRGTEEFPSFYNVEYGNIYDTGNVYTKVNEILDPSIQKIMISTPSGHPCHIPFRYLLRVEWKDQSDEIFNSVIRLPEIILGEGESLTLYLSRDWSVYYDQVFHRLACTNQL